MEPASCRRPKATPKNLLNVWDRPILAHVVAEGLAAGIEHFVFVVGRGQGAIEDYFDHAYELEAQLQAKGKTEILSAVREALLEPGQMSFVRQMAPRGLGHAVFCARDIVGDAPFAVMLPDMLMDAAPAALAQAVAAHEAVGRQHRRGRAGAGGRDAQVWHRGAGATRPRDSVAASRA